MANLASPSSSPSKEASQGGEDELWEEAFAKMDEQTPLFQKLPETEEDARKVFEKCDDKSHVGPIVLVKGVLLVAFGDWVRRSELGLHKAERLANGTVYVPQAYAPDHGILCGLLHKSNRFPVLDDSNASYLKYGSGTHGSQNPDVFWFRSGERSKHSRVLFEVGLSQSLPDLRRRAYALCSAEQTWEKLAYVVLVKRYTVRRVYVEIWKRIASQVGTDTPALRNDQRAPQVLGVTERRKPWNLLRTLMLSTQESDGMIHSRGNLICRPAMIFLPVMIFWLAGQLLPLMRRHFWINVNTTIQRSKCEERAEGMYSGRLNSDHNAMPQPAE